nr:hypothetical protein [Micromonospora sp. DSM 115978]
LAAGRPERASECYERLGDHQEALDCCPAEATTRLVRLVRHQLPELDALAERQQFVEAVRTAGRLVDHLQRAAAVTDSGGDLADCLAAVVGRRSAVVLVGRRHLDAQQRQAPAAQRASVLASWSAFEEAAGDWAAAAHQAERAGDLYRAHRLYRQAGQFGQADRVLRDDSSEQALATRADSLEAGGDPVAAARLHEAAGQHDRAFEMYVAMHDFAAAASCLLRQRGDDAVDDPRLADCLRRAGEFDRLVRLCLR